MAKSTITVKILGDAKNINKVLDGVGDKARGFAGVIGGAVKGGAIAAGAATAAGLGKGFADALDITKGTDILAGQLGLTGDEAERFGQASAELYGGAWGDSLDQVNEGLSLVSRNIGDSLGPAEDALEKTTARALDLNSAFGSDLSLSTQAVGRLIKTGLADNAEDAFDIITAGLQGGADSAGDLIETFQEYSTTLRDVGLDGETATGLFIQGLEGGARATDTVADALKEFAIRGQDASEASADGFKLIGLDAEEMTRKVAAGGPEARDALDQVLDALRPMEGTAEGTAAAVALFGTKAEDLGDALFDLDLDAAAADMGNVAGASDRLGDTINDNLSTRFEEFKRKGLQGFATFAERFLFPAAEKIIAILGERIPPVVEKVRQFFEDNWPAIQAAIALYVEYLETVVLPVAQAIFEGVVGFAAVVVAWFEENWPLIQAVIAGVVEWFQTVALPIIEQVLAFIVAEFENLQAWIDENWPAIQKTIADAIEAIRIIIEKVLQIITAVWEEHGSAILAFITKTWGTIKTVVQAAIDIVRGIINTVTALIRGDWSGVWEGIKTVLSGVWEGIKSIVKLAIDAVGLALRLALDGIKLGWDTMWKAAATFISDRWEDITSTVSGGVDGLVGFVTGLPGRISSAVSGAFDPIWEGFKDVLNNIIDGWNGLQLGPWSFGGGSVFGVDLPTVTIGPFGTPDIPRFHSGGYVGNRNGPPTEVPAILQQGEYVMSRREVAAGAGARGGPIIHVENMTIANGLDADAFGARVAMKIGRAA